jgi:hypothetical protein
MEFEAEGTEAALAKALMDDVKCCHLFADEQHLLPV